MITVRRIFAAASLALCMTAFNACVKEEAQEQIPAADENLVEVTFEASSVGVKSTFDGDARKINWELTDKVAVYDGTAKRQFSVTTIEGGVATLKGHVADDATEFYAVYPYSAAGEELPVDGAVNIVLPQEQTLAEGKNFDEDAFVTVGKVEDGSIAFKNVVSLLKINIPADVTSVKLISYSTEKFAGAATAKTDRTTTAGSAASVELKPSAATFTAGEHYIALLPTTFEKGFRIVYTQDSQIGVSKTTAKVVFPVNDGFDVTGSAPSWIPTVIMNETQLRNYFANQDLFGATEVKLGQNITLASAWTPVALTGKLDGQNHTISGLNVSTTKEVGFFSKVNAGASVKNLTIEGTINAKNPSSAAKSYVGVAGRVSGTMENITNKANITLAADIQYSGLIGGIAGNIHSGGKLIGCTNMGNITTTGTAGTETWYIGGIAGYVGDPSGAGWDNNNAGATISTCVNEGTLTVDNANVESVGGIVGMFRGGSIASCENKGSFVVTKTLNGRYLGGIVGYVQNRSGKKAVISGCINNAAIDLTASATTLSTVGGIIGMAHRQPYEVEVSGCYNKKPISVSSTGVLNLGGIVATYGSTGTGLFKFSDCHNQAAVSCVNLETTTAFLDIAAYVGGVAGITGGVTDFDNCTNSGAVSSNRLSKNYVGGIVGYAGGTTKVLSSVNSGTVTANPSQSVTTADYVGGIVALATGTLTMTGNTNAATGSASLIAQSSQGYRSAVGGIVGHTDATSHTMTGNINKAAVLSDCSNTHTPAGGVIGMVKGNLTMSNNINFGSVTAASTKTSDVFAGGIVGMFDMLGTSGATDNKTATLIGDKSFGAIASAARSGLLFAVYAYNCYGNVTIKDCVVGGSRQQGTGAATTITASNFASHLWSWVRSGSVGSTLLQSNTTYGEASAYESAAVEGASYVVSNW